MPQQLPDAWLRCVGLYRSSCLQHISQSDTCVQCHRRLCGPVLLSAVPLHGCNMLRSHFSFLCERPKTGQALLCVLHCHAHWQRWRWQHSGPLEGASLTMNTVSQRPARKCGRRTKACHKHCISGLATQVAAAATRSCAPKHGEVWPKCNSDASDSFAAARTDVGCDEQQMVAADAEVGVVELRRQCALMQAHGL
jgi:hypothetical protein